MIHFIKLYLVNPQIYYNSLLSINLGENTIFFLSRISGNDKKHGIFSEAINGIILSGYFYSAKCGKLLGR